MKKETINNYYTDEDLINFKKLNNFKEFKSDKLNNIQKTKYPVKYSMSDNNNFKKIMNIENSEISSFKEDNKSKENSYYNSLDFQKFNKLKQFTNFENSKDSKTKKEDSKSVTSYTSDDVNKFDKIIKTKNQSINNKAANNKKIKIIDFGKLKEKEKNFKNKLGIEKIKVVYFD